MRKLYKFEILCMFAAAAFFLIEGGSRGFAVDYRIAGLLAFIAGILIEISEKLTGSDN